MWINSLNGCLFLWFNDSSSTHTEGNEMTESQKQGMIRFHLRAAAAYRKVGVIEKAKQAEAQAKKLQGAK